MPHGIPLLLAWWKKKSKEDVARRDPTAQGNSQSVAACPSGDSLGAIGLQFHEFILYHIAFFMWIRGPWV